MIFDAILMLKSSELVAKFQSICGVRRISPKKSDEKHHEVTNRFFKILFTFGSLIGDEEFLIVLFAFLHWNVDPLMTRRTMMLWSFTLYIGQTLKGFIRIPRPSAPPVVYLETRHLREYGFPSTHAGAALAISYGLATFARYDLLLGSSGSGSTGIASATSSTAAYWLLPNRLVFCVVWTSLVSLSRLYKGVHSMLDVLGGLGYTAIIIYVLAPIIPALDSLLTTGHVITTTSGVVTNSASVYSALWHLVVAISGYLVFLGLGLLTWFIPQTPLSPDSSTTSESSHASQHTVTPFVESSSQVQACGARSDCLIAMSTLANFGISAFIHIWLNPSVMQQTYASGTPNHLLAGSMAESRHALLRTGLGALCVGALFMLGKPLVYRRICLAQGLDPRPQMRAQTRYRFCVELPFIFVLYTCMVIAGFGVLPAVFAHLSCQLSGINFFP